MAGWLCLAQTESAGSSVAGTTGEEADGAWPREILKPDDAGAGVAAGAAEAAGG